MPRKLLHLTENSYDTRRKQLYMYHPCRLIGRSIILSLNGDLLSLSYHTLISFVYATKNLISSTPETMEMKVELNRILISSKVWHVKRCNIWSFPFVFYNSPFVFYNVPFVLYNFLFVFYIFHLYCIIFYLYRIISICILYFWFVFYNVLFVLYNFLFVF
jgi:hypothetical protein